MFYDKTILGADYSASKAPADAIQAIADFDLLAPTHIARRDSTASPEARKGTWFDEGYDFREPAGTTFATAVLAAIAVVDTRKNKRNDEDQHNHEMIVRKVIANAVRCTCLHAPALVAVQLRASAYKGKPTWLNGKAMARTTKLLADAGLIERVKGTHRVAATTLTASPALLFMALDSGATEPALIYRMPGDRIIRLRAGNRETELVAFELNAERQAWSDRLVDYNQFLAGRLYESEAPKRTIGSVWAEASEGHCLFCMPTEQNFALMDQTIAMAKPV